MTFQPLTISYLSENSYDVVEGIKITRTYDLVSQMLGGFSGASTILAKPVENAQGDAIEWHTSLSGPYAPYEYLTPEDKKIVHAFLHDFSLRISTASAVLNPAESPKTRVGGIILKKIGDSIQGFLEGKETEIKIFLAGNVPVVTGWGLARIKGLARSSVIPGQGQLTPNQPTPDDGDSALWNGARVIISALLTVMLATALFFALNRGGIAFLFTSNNALPIDDSKPRLERELFALKNNYFQTLEACVRIEPEPELEPLAKEDILTEDEEAEDLIILSVNAPKDEPEIQPGQGLVIPEGGDPNDLSFLEGCWESVSNLFNSITDLPVVYVYCFNKTGKGTATLKEYDKAGKHTGTCESNTTAKRRGDAVVIQDNGVRCGNHRYYKSKLTCRNEKGGTAKCDIDHHRRKFDSNFKFLGKS